MTMSLLDHYWDKRYKQEQHPCAHCKGTGSIKITSTPLPLSSKLVAYAGAEKIIQNQRRKCAECLGDGYRTFKVKR